MARSRKRRKHPQFGDGFVALPWYLLESPAYRSLSGNSVAALIEVLQRYRGGNNGKIQLSVRDAAARLGVSTTTAQKALRELQDRGVVRVATAGSFNVKGRHATEWTVTLHGVGDAPATKDFMRWAPPEKQNTVLDSSTVGTRF